MGDNNRKLHARAIKDHAAFLGFDACGIAAAGAADPDDRLGTWLLRGFHADMAWMERTRAQRQDVQQLLPGARSVVVLARNYYRPRPVEAPASGKVARYAWGRDYHKVLKKPLKQLAQFVETLDAQAQNYLCIDSGPVLERSWAERAGLGWVGKNSLILRRDLGSWFFLCTLITTLDLTPDAPATEHCGSCRACIDACPTGAIVEAGVVDSRRCISYQTIENRGEIPDGLHEQMGSWVFGCDICQEVCPWNRFAEESSETQFQPQPGVANPVLSEIEDMDENGFYARFAGTPLPRTKLKGLKRNAHIAARNAGAE